MKDWTMHHHRPGGATALGVLVAALLALLTPVGGGVDAAALAPARASQDIVRQSAFDPRPGPANSPGTFASSGAVDVSLAVLTLDPLPVSVAAGRNVAVSAQVPPGAACSGSVAYPGRRWQPLDDVAARTDGCAWDLPVPVGSRPGSLTVALDVSKGGQGRSLYGVVYVDVAGVGR